MACVVTNDAVSLRAASSKVKLVLNCLLKRLMIPGGAWGGAWYDQPARHLEGRFRPAGPSPGSVQGDQHPHRSRQRGGHEFRGRSTMWLLQCPTCGFCNDAEDRGLQADDHIVSGNPEWLISIYLAIHQLFWASLKGGGGVGLVQEGDQVDRVHGEQEHYWQTWRKIHGARLHPHHLLDHPYGFHENYHVDHNHHMYISQVLGHRNFNKNAQPINKMTFPSMIEVKIISFVISPMCNNLKWFPNVQMSDFHFWPLSLSRLHIGLWTMTNPRENVCSTGSLLNSK